MRTQSIRYDALVDLGTSALEAVGVSETRARRVAELFAMSELEGAVSHGMARLPVLLRRIHAGMVDAHAEVAVLRESAATAVLDARHGVGQLVADTAMHIAIAKATASGVGFVAVQNSSHFGRAGHIAMLATEAGMIGVAASNASPRIVPGPDAEPVLGNNPWAVAWPCNGGPRCVDMANSVVAAGKIRAAMAAGRKIPHGWALDGSGKDTDDPAAGLLGSLIAMGGHKGWALSLAIDIMAGGLSGGAMGLEVASTDAEGPQRTAHFFMALDVQAFQPLHEFRERAQALEEELRARSGPDARLPGDRSRALRRERRVNGVPVSEATLTEIESTLRDLQR